MRITDSLRGTSWMHWLIGAMVTALPAHGQQDASEVTPAANDGVYAVVDLRDLEVFDLSAPATPGSASSEALVNTLVNGPWEPVLHWRGESVRATLDGSGAAVISMPRQQVFINMDRPTPSQLAVHLSEARDVTGRLYVPTTDDLAMVPVGFRIPARAFGSTDRAPFWRAVASHATHHLIRRDSGSAWYRHLRSSARAALDEVELPTAPGPRPPNASLYTLKGSFELLSGSRALSENLALDQLLAVSANDEDSVDIESIEGITVRAYDWSALVADIDPELDALSAIIPADQHGLFFASFAAMVAVSDEAEALGEPILLALESRSQTARTRQRYEQQLGLSMSQLARLIGPHLIASVALTGGDAYLRTGSDVAVLFETTDSLATLAAISARVNLSFAYRDDVDRVTGEIEGLAYTGLISADRSACSYIATVGPAVVVTNSTAQLARLARAARGDVTTLAELPEYRWFRERYPLNSPEASALLVLSDDTIRRWCGPRVRIGSSRRARAAAVLSELTARQISSTTHQLFLPQTDLAELISIGPVHVDGGLVNSVGFGNLGFATPISELDLDQVSESERAFYDLWRAGYERNWRQVFDPIAVQFSVGPEGLSLDTTVRPLVFSSDYDRLARLSRGGLIEPLAGDPHNNALVHFAMAVDLDEVEIMPEMGMVQMLAPNLDVFGWMGTSVAFYVDNTDYWDEIEGEGGSDEFIMTSFDRFPFAFHAEVSNNLKLALFLTGMRGMIESTAPGTTTWETRSHREHKYVRISETVPSIGGEPELAVYYVSGDEGLTVTLSEELIWRVIDRRLQRFEITLASDTNSQPASEPPASESVGMPPVEPWLGQHMALRLDGPTLARAMTLWGDALFHEQQRSCWGNLPILNVWHERFPEEDPLIVHERIFQRRLLCPSGGSYRWNEDFQTMESTSHGHPGQPQENKTLPTALQDLAELSFGLDFEEDGLRARARVRRTNSDH